VPWWLKLGGGFRILFSLAFLLAGSLSQEEAKELIEIINQDYENIDNEW
jgi:hypothetical protein